MGKVLKIVWNGNKGQVRFNCKIKRWPFIYLYTCVDLVSSHAIKSMVAGLALTLGWSMYPVVWKKIVPGTANGKDGDCGHTATRLVEMGQGPERGYATDQSLEAGRARGSKWKKRCVQNEAKG